MEYSWLTDAQLEMLVKDLLEAAHDAPKTGNAWTQRSNDWLKASTELDRRRGIRQ
jgi:hypothetical protein